MDRGGLVVDEDDDLVVGSDAVEVGDGVLEYLLLDFLEVAALAYVLDFDEYAKARDAEVCAVGAVPEFGKGLLVHEVEGLTTVALRPQEFLVVLPPGSTAASNSVSVTFSFAFAAARLSVTPGMTLLSRFVGPLTVNAPLPDPTVTDASG